jgi:hypothetical protein
MPLISARLPLTAEWRPFSQARALAFAGEAELGNLETEVRGMADILSTELAWMLSASAVLPPYFTPETWAVIFRQLATSNPVRAVRRLHPAVRRSSCPALAP